MKKDALLPYKNLCSVHGEAIMKILYKKKYFSKPLHCWNYINVHDDCSTSRTESKKLIRLTVVCIHEKESAERANRVGKKPGGTKKPVFD